eukprot:12402953-Karenia_brevis.AAC.1
MERTTYHYIHCIANASHLTITGAVNMGQGPAGTVAADACWCPKWRCKIRPHGNCLLQRCMPVRKNDGMIMMMR